MHRNWIQRVIITRCRSNSSGHAITSDRISAWYRIIALDIARANGDIPINAFCRWTRVSSGLVGEKETCIATPKALRSGFALSRSNAGPYFTHVHETDIEIYDSKHGGGEAIGFALHSAPTISRSLRFQSNNDDNSSSVNGDFS